MSFLQVSLIYKKYYKISEEEYKSFFEDAEKEEEVEETTSIEDLGDLISGAVEEFVVEGIATTIPLHLKIMNDPVFIEGRDVTTAYIPQLLSSG